MGLPIDQIICGDCLEELQKLPDECIDCCVTSPPYFGLRDYGVEWQIGLESTPDEYVAKLVEVFREVKRVLKKEGTLWLNLGDSYSANRSYQVTQTKHKPLDYVGSNTTKIPDGMKPKDLIGTPWMVAFALRADGWYLRSDIIWYKPNTMPESVKDRPTKSHEYIFLLSKSQKYYYDDEAIKEGAVSDHKSGNGFKRPARVSYQNPDGTARGNDNQWGEVGGKRNARTVWTIATKPFSEAHFATFPEKLVEPCIVAGTSEKGVCPNCGVSWVRQTEKERYKPLDYNGKNSLQDKQFSGRRMSANTRAARLNGGSHDNPFSAAKTIGWHPSCSCNLEPVPGTVLDPFFGAGTTGLVAKKLGRHYIGIELNPEYCEIARKRISAVPMRLDNFASLEAV